MGGRGGGGGMKRRLSGRAVSNEAWNEGSDVMWIERSKVGQKLGKRDDFMAESSERLAGMRGQTVAWRGGREKGECPW